MKEKIKQVSDKVFTEKNLELANLAVDVVLLSITLVQTVNLLDKRIEQFKKVMKGD